MKAGQRLSLAGLHSHLSKGACELPVRLGDAQCVLRLEASERERNILLEGGVLNYRTA